MEKHYAFAPLENPVGLNGPSVFERKSGLKHDMVNLAKGIV